MDAERPRVAIVTGASRGIGAGIAAAFRRSGYAVVATSRTIDPSDEHDLVTVQGDLADAATARAIVAHAVERFGRLDVLVNNAGIYLGKRFTESTTEDLAALVAVNLTGFFHVTQQAIRQMLAQGGGGHVVTVTTSIVDHPRASSPAALTALTKGGLAAATRALAIEHAADGIRVNAVSPGVVRTPEHEPASYDGLADLHPLGRVGEIGDVVEAVLYLDRAPFVTGETVHVDGGQAAGG
jgi:NAD(P)-dependent dehydrogenase (short-subunit alcohol dehydrogenase family)